MLLSSTTSRADAAPESTDPPLEVKVVAEPKEPGEQQLRAKEVAQMPGAFGDPFRAIESMPGVVPVFSGVPYFYVRGAPPSSNGFVIDGVTIPLLFHLGAGPSVLAPGLVDEVSFHPSVAPVSLGRYDGGFVSARTRGPAMEPHLEGMVRPYEIGLLAETPVGDADVLIGGRYGNPTPIVKVFQSNADLQYGDYQARVGYRLSRVDRVSVFAFGALDRLVADDRLVEDVRFHRVDLRWDHAFDDGGDMRLAVTLANDESRIGDLLNQTDMLTTTTMKGVGARFTYDRVLAPSVRLRAGADAWFMRYANTTTSVGYEIAEAHDETPIGAYADLVLTPAKGVEIIPGVRIDRYLATEDEQKFTTPIASGLHTPTTAYPAVNDVGVDPRLRVKLDLGDGFSWVSAVGVAHQGPQYAAPFPGVQLSSTSTKLQESFQLAEGIEAVLPEKIFASLTAFRSVARNVRDIVFACSDPGATGATGGPVFGRTFQGGELSCGQGDEGNVTSHGLELLVRRDLSKRVGGMIAYTLSRSVRDDGSPTRYDRTHVLSTILSVALGRGWRAGGRFSYQSGRTMRASYPASDGSARIDFDRRLPPFHRVDVRLEKRWHVGEEGHVALVFEVLNATLQKEPTAYVNCTSPTQCDVRSIGPLTIPSVGLEGSF